VFRIRILLHGDFSQIFFPHAMHFEIAVHHLGKKVGEDEDFALAFVGV
jgi:hypothetical protein